ncbi:S-4TM family putative pore-forming effector [Inquilinus sp. Marseille-Q2685]|uniref:S-4TM family putative pore-forming effector n=1 Tax=Inquilinus sp. Marseille-Q2685 TaxID=2866581 RepID=UPI001CE3FCF1|nr:S-4TM family putative pore-forming effector [Inquilinus sp. Marseille-Q2685]
MNEIPVIQNDERQLKLLRARKQTYANATLLMVVQLGLALGIPIIGGILATLRPELKAYVAAASLAVVALDVLILDRSQKKLIRQAARIGEQFDCAVFDLPWDQFSIGERVEAEDIHAAAKAFARRADDAKLRNWYPEAVGNLPLHLARIICQRTNLHYDARLRRSYSSILKAISICLIGALAISGLIQNVSMTAWVLTMAPAMPFLSWAAREYYRQVDTADSLEMLMKEARNFWKSAVDGECGVDVCRARSREFQNAIYSRRATSPLVLPFLYKFKRLALEDEMNEGAADLVHEYERSLSRNQRGGAAP